MSFRLYSKDFEDGDRLPMNHVANAFGYEGGNKSPQLAWDNVPEGTKSLVLTAYDPDAPTGSGFWHWGVVDLPGDIREVSAGASTEGSLPPDSRQTRNDWGTKEYVGAAPPPGPPHRYVFTVRALSVDKLAVPDDASGALVGWMAGMHTLEIATLTAIFGA